ncbi:hypothetical protein VP01_179g6 [Puccinia sorghi]|uniref:Uncharacterized protein n=1 Tax=Puccinia sorghi TaxID=27349 RepID=A0A0L6VEG7_9BASI|nr:hypothetical protein VP01_179g6 [Puccinia sorghi]
MLISTCILLATIRTYYSRENEIQMIREMMENLTQAMLSLEGCALAFLLIVSTTHSVFMPLLCVSWRDLSLKAEFLSMKLSQERNENSLELTRLMETTQDARTTLLYRSFSVFFGMTACMPVLCWQLTTRSFNSLHYQQLYYSQKAFSGMSTQYYAISYFVTITGSRIFLREHNPTDYQCPLHQNTSKTKPLPSSSTH